MPPAVEYLTGLHGSGRYLRLALTTRATPYAFSAGCTTTAGAGGRIALGDALELGPTYGVGPQTVLAHQAGGPAATEQAEDAAPDPADPDRPVVGDLVIGVTASGRTPSVLGALAAALLSGGPAAPAAARADLHVLLATGPEVITGSTRMKAGTAQRLALNIFHVEQDPGLSVLSRTGLLARTAGRGPTAGARAALSPRVRTAPAAPASVTPGTWASPRELRDLQIRVRAEQQAPGWQARHAIRSGIEGTLNALTRRHGMRHRRYRG
ncbi:hypothetical protein [Kitasatospora sp. MMS16-BH015]|uniref:hypothetical protein n=1 Tax=Kitasatospora sp. MMS16-BH015 TaxID=2018025 RepID=UPI000CF2C0EE|nr:hypothetical protein [Kitasatospora sp. MMS16-BH015]